MINQTVKKYPLILLVIILLINTLNTQAQAERTKILGAYVYNFAQLSSSPKQDKLPTYNISVFTDEQDIIQEFKNMEQDLLVEEKKITVSVPTMTGDINMQQACMVFLGADKLEEYTYVFNKSKEYEVLLVSENYDNKSKILLNLYETDNGKMLFEINKGNIYQRKIKIDDEILLMGGSEIDLVQLYLNSQHRLNQTELKLQNAQQKFNELAHQVTNSEKKLRQFEAKILEQIEEREKLIGDLNAYQREIKSSKEASLQSMERLNTYNDSLKKSELVLNEYKLAIDEKEKFLQQQEQEITEKEQKLNQKNTVIARQRTAVIIFIIGLILVSLLAVLLFRSYKDKQKKNNQLKQQKEEIIYANNALKDSNEEVKAINDKLKEKNEELTASLEEIKRIQNQLIQTEKMASLGVLSAGIAHEINNPINFVYAGINSLMRDFQDIEPVIKKVSQINPKTDDIIEKLKKIEQLKKENYFDDAIEAIPELINDIKIGADRTAEIVKGLKSFSRLDKTELQELNIHEGLDTSLLLLKNKYKNHIVIEKDYDNTIPYIKCYPGKINQAFLNLISNAIDSIDEKGIIRISTKRQENNVIISIKDNGCGIPDKIRKKLFDPFFTTKAVGKGTGLGLSITYGIICEHAGTIDIKSENNHGTEFIIGLPIS